eukprot:symbB.v1.2.027406.t1/scaffold2802.1/size122644/2
MPKVAASKALSVLRKRERDGFCCIEADSVYGAAVAMPQIARSCGWPGSLIAVVIRVYFFTLLNFLMQGFLLSMIGEEQLMLYPFAGQMHLCNFGANIKECPDASDCKGPMGTTYSMPRLYSFPIWSTRVFVRDSLKAAQVCWRSQSVSVVELIFHTATVIVMGCAASVEPKAALPPVQRYNFVGPEIGRSSSMLDSAESREICPISTTRTRTTLSSGRLSPVVVGAVQNYSRVRAYDAEEWEAAFGDFLRRMEVDSDPCKPIDSSGDDSTFEHLKMAQTRQHFATRMCTAHAAVFPDMAEEIDAKVDPGEYGLENYQCRLVRSPSVEMMDDEEVDAHLGIHDLTEDDLFGPSSPLLVSDEEPLVVDSPEPKRQRLDVEDVSAASGSADRRESNAGLSGLGHLALKSADMGQFKFPWEKGSLARIFMNEPVVSVPVPKIQPGRHANFRLTLEVGEGAKAAPVINLDTRTRESNFFAGVVKSASDMSYKQERAKKRMEAIEEWWYLLSTSLGNSTVGKQVLAETYGGDAKEVGCKILDACFSLKSPGTLRKRLAGLKGYYVWYRDNATGDWLPMSERGAWLYVNHLKQSKAPATTASTFMESCRFAWFILGVSGAGSIESSLRVKGMSAQLKLNKRAWCPADVLKLSEVKRMHQLLFDESAHIIDRVFVGHCLHLMYGRCRWSDMLAVQNAFVDDHGQFFELETQVHKSARSADTKTKLMPIVSPCLGVVDAPWVPTYLEVRKRCGLDLPMEDATHMLPAPADSSGTWHGRYLTSEEGSDFLRAILNVPKKSGRRISSHSLKSTTISWASKFGIPMESRAILARHTTALQNPTVLYSRDLQTPVLREYTAMLAAVKAGGFVPDASRSGMVHPEKVPQMPGTPSNLAGFRQSQQFDADAGDEGGGADSPLSRLDDGLSTPKAASEDRGDRVTAAARFLKPEDLEDRLDDVDLSETSEEASVQSTSSEEQEVAQVSDAEQLEETAQYFINMSSSVAHSCRGQGVFKCGRKITKAYSPIYELQGIRMSSLADSEAHFQSRADEYGVPADVLTNIKNAGIRTLGQLAFAFARPGQEYTDTQFLAWLKDANAGVDPTMGASASVRRLHFESEVIVTASLKAAVETPSSDSSVPKPIPIAEKNVRMQKLRNDLGGINVEGPHEPSHALIEECVQQYDNRILKYIEPSKCTSRESELLAQKVDKRLQLDHNSVLKVKDSKTIPDADAATAFALLQCFRRRGIAYEFAQLISFTAHDKYIDALLRHLLAANFDEVRLISNVCPGNHYHEAWGVVAKGAKRVFATSLEVHYPPLLCDAIVQAFLACFLKLGCVEVSRVPQNPAAQLLTGKQPRSSKVLPAVPEYKSKLLLLKDAANKVVWPVNPPSHSAFKLLHAFSVGDEGMDQLLWSLDQACLAFKIDKCILPKKIPSDVAKLEIFGVPWSPMEFVEQARDFVHPLAVERSLPSVLIEAVEAHNGLSEVEIAKDRLKQVLHWNNRAKALQEREDELKASLDPIVASTIRQKRLLLFEEMLKAASYPDLDVLSELKLGSNLVGNIPVTGVLPCKFVPATSSIDSLHAQASFVRGRANRLASSSGSPSVDESVWNQTLSEVSEGWIHGPIPLNQIPKSAPITRRFGITQGEKIRLIDDYSMSGVNACVTSAEAPALHTVDTAGALLCKWLSKRSECRLSPELLARTFDLKSAYRQIALSREGRDYSYFAVFNPTTGETCFFQSLVLPFGATRSVHSFLRLARSIWWIGAYLFRLLWTSFYDDYILFSPPGLAKNAEQTAKSLLRLLGWIFAEDGKKAQPFSSMCPALGVVFDLHRSGDGCCFIKNTRSELPKSAGTLTG